MGAPRPFATNAPLRAAPSCTLPATAAPRDARVQCAGFGAGGSKAAKKQPRIARILEEEGVIAPLPAAASDSDGWFQVPDVDAATSFLSKPIKPVILATGRAICLFKVEDTVYCTDANSTAFKYPLSDANLLQLKTGPAVETKLDGTTYDLKTGKVLSWCPKNNPVRAVLGSLKDKSEPIDLPVYPVRVEGTKVMVKLSA